VTRSVALLLVLAAFPAAWANDPEPPVKGGPIQGTWVFVKAIGQGGGPGGELELTFQKDKMSVKNGGRHFATHTFTIDPKKKPAHIDLIDGNNKNKKVAGIYKIEKGELYLCIGERTGARPTSFDGKSESVLVLKRQKK
jgi:uncharacterized protein (TIGR03067 family)